MRVILGDHGGSARRTRSRVLRAVVDCAAEDLEVDSLETRRAGLFRVHRFRLDGEVAKVRAVVQELQEFTVEAVLP